jgi:molybdopterin converting factor small subunit
MFDLDVLCFGPARDAAGGEVVRISVDAAATVEQALKVLADGNDALADLLPCCAIAVGDEIVTRDHALSPGDELAILPPVSGGCG